jgi:hypothetical protein
VSVWLSIWLAFTGPAGHGDTYRLEFDNGVCSATAVGPHTILTAAHCFEDGHALVKVGDRPAHGIRAVADGKDHELVRLNITFKHWARFGPEPEAGQQIHYWGNPAGLHDILRQGYMVGYDAGTLLFDVNGFFGDSGAGIMDDEGRVCGVLSGLTQQTYHGLTWRLTGVHPLTFTADQMKIIQ